MEQSTYGNFNANTNNLDESCKCKQCANRFYRFTQEFVGLNTSINSIEHKLNTYNLRNKQVVWRSMLKEQLDLFKLFNTIIYIPSCPFLQLQHINVQYELLHKQKFPMINSTDAVSYTHLTLPTTGISQVVPPLAFFQAEDGIRDS